MIRTGTGLRSRLHQILRLDEELDRYILREADHASLVLEACERNFHASTALEGNPP